MTDVAVIGAGGFVGQAILNEGKRRGVDCRPYPSSAINLLSENVGQLVEENINDGDSIVFCSALTPEHADGVELFNKNYYMMINFLEAVKKKHLSFFTYISTDAVYSLSLDRVNETKPTEPETLYGMSHLVREKLVKEYISENKLIILRPCAIYGEGDPHNAYGVMRFLREAKHGGSIKIFGEGEEFRDHLFIDDFASIALEAIFSKISGIFNVASGKSTRFIDLANLIADLFENAVSVDNLPRKMDVMHRHYDLTKLWKAFPHLLPRGIKRGVTDLFHNGNLG